MDKDAVIPFESTQVNTPKREIAMPKNCIREVFSLIMILAQSNVATGIHEITQPVSDAVVKPTPKVSNTK